MTDTSISYGSKYDGTLNVRVIAKMVRADIKTATGTIPHLLPKGLKAAVKIRRYSMGQSIDVTIKVAPGVTVLNPTRLAEEIAAPHVCSRLPIHTDEARAILDAVKVIVEAYNFDGSDIQTDYFHVNFYSDVKFDYAIEGEERDAIKAA